MLSFSLVNIVEAKVFEKNDTTGKPKKIKIIDNFGINTSYNIFADSLRWAPITLDARTTIKNNISISLQVAVFHCMGPTAKESPIG